MTELLFLGKEINRAQYEITLKIEFLTNKNYPFCPTKTYHPKIFTSNTNFFIFEMRLYQHQKFNILIHEFWIYFIRLRKRYWNSNFQFFLISKIKSQSWKNIFWGLRSSSTQKIIWIFQNKFFFFCQIFKYINITMPVLVDFEAFGFSHNIRFWMDLRTNHSNQE